MQLVIVLRKGFGALLRKYQSVNELRDNECLFPGKAKNIPITRQVASNLFKKYLLLANLPDLRIHSLRHSFATHMRDEGMDLLTLMELLGHQKLQTTLNYTQSYYRRNAHIRIKEHEEFYRKFRSRK
ncbi:tyrosine-type recombinase/integrase [Paenibacillus sp. FSL L8-0696]|uniref:tyrosine-type recombinase/integrase n=1 Tax=Paenibacillus sp. FSL L8-0696 TaxID=2954524 RepID=UPI003119CA1A